MDEIPCFLAKEKASSSLFCVDKLLSSYSFKKKKRFIQSVLFCFVFEFCVAAISLL